MSLGSEHTRTCFRKTAADFVDALIDLGVDLRSATVEDVRDAIEAITAGRSASTAKQYVLRVKSLLSYAHKLGYTRFNAGTTIKVRSCQDSGELAKRIISELEVSLLVRAARDGRNRLLIQTLYGGGLRVAELCGLTWGDVIDRGDLLQLSVTGKGGKVRQVLLPETLSRNLLASRGDAGANDPIFPTRSGKPMTPRGVHAVLERIAKATVTARVSPHWLRHAHASHALDHGATLAEVQATLGHASVGTTSTYLHARPKSSSGLKLDAGVFDV